MKVARSLLPLASLLLLSCVAAAVRPAGPAKPKSIILLIADGSGSAQFTVARMLRGADFQIGRMPYTGLVATSPLEDSIVTDSGAAATAFATGVRTKYTMIGSDASGTAQTTVLEVAEQLGKSTALVTTTNFWDATPAAFAAHASTRYEADFIISQMLSAGVEIIIGGGAARFGVEGQPTIEELAESTGYTPVRSPAELAGVTGERILAVFPTEKHEIDFAGVRLPELARWTIERLARDPDGFFAMIEHEGPDGAAHANETDLFIASMISFDEAVGVALDFAATRDDVLVLVVGDHETGGLQIVREKGTTMELIWGRKGHTGEAVPIFAMGPGAEFFVGFFDGEDVGKRILRLLRP